MAGEHQDNPGVGLTCLGLAGNETSFKLLFFQLSW